MLTRPIPSTGEAMPVIGLGTWRAFDVGADAAVRRPLHDLLRLLLDAGGRMIDSSPMYGRAEAVTGDLLAEQAARPRAFLATKVWTTGRERGIEQMRASARLLRSEVIDLMRDWRATGDGSGLSSPTSRWTCLRGVLIAGSAELASRAWRRVIFSIISCRPPQRTRSPAGRSGDLNNQLQDRQLYTEPEQNPQGDRRGQRTQKPAFQLRRFALLPPDGNLIFEIGGQIRHVTSFQMVCRVTLRICEF
jgi:hypothetical protein